MKNGLDFDSAQYGVEGWFFFAESAPSLAESVFLNLFRGRLLNFLYFTGIVFSINVFLVVFNLK